MQYSTYHEILTEVNDAEEDSDNDGEEKDNGELITESGIEKEEKPIRILENFSLLSVWRINVELFEKDKLWR